MSRSFAIVEGLHSDGGNLYLQTDGGPASWVFRFMRSGKRRCMGLERTINIAFGQAESRMHMIKAILVATLGD